jgi:phospholipid/cholesterol/gamma-HCH transport system substrate-binding protein
MIEIDEQATAFVRRDSAAIIRRRFGVAGAAFVDISRGTGEELDWSYAVIEATTERAPTDSINAMIDEVRGKVFPILDNAGRATQALAEIMERINRGEGNVGRVLVDQTLMQQAEATVESANQAVVGLNQLLARLQKSAGDVNELTDKDVPALMNRLQAVLRDLAQASNRMPAISRNVEGSTANLPALLTQLQVTTRELDRLMVQLRGSWLLGGNPPPQAPKQFSPSQVLP